MRLMLISAAVLTLATLLLVLLWRLGLALFRRRPAPGFWRRALLRHAGLFVLHAFLTVPLLLGSLAPRFVGTRPDERAYAGPRIAPDGTWTLQSRESLAAERPPDGADRPAPAPSEWAVSLRASDGVPLRAFLVPPAEGPPRFAALLAHGIFRGALELETVGSMLRDLGGEVLLLEWRNHGGSGRAKATFGLDESLDVLAGVEFLRSRPEAAGLPRIVFAVSLGTAAASLAAPRIPDLSGLILDAPMDDLEPTLLRALAMDPVPIRQPWAGTVLWSMRHLAGVPIERVVPVRALARLPPRVEVLLIGAGHDERMPPEAVTALYESLPTPPEHKSLWIEPEATHGKVWVVAPEEYRRRLARFCDAVAPEPPDAPPPAD